MGLQTVIGCVHPPQILLEPVANSFAVFSPLIIGCWVNLILWTLEVVGLGLYYIRFKNDSRFVRSCLTGTFLFDTIATVCTCIHVYDYTALHFGNYQYLEQSHWPLIVIVGAHTPPFSGPGSPTFHRLQVATSGVSGLALHSFLLNRVWLLSKNYIVATGVALLALTAFGSSLATSVNVGIYTEVAQRSQLLVMTTVWMVASAASDLSAASALLFLLYRAHKNVGHFGQRVLEEASGCSGRDGSGDQHLRSHNTLIIIGPAINKLYTLTVLFNLHLRTSGSEIASPKTVLDPMSRRPSKCDIGDITIVTETTQIVEDERGILSFTDFLMEKREHFAGIMNTPFQVLTAEEGKKRGIMMKEKEERLRNVLREETTREMSEMV
ncbi:hypothetical protein P7C70_g2750, partial [Phenoliferia sp. Uapishka_3]